jgi:hypothetical protein
MNTCPDQIWALVLFRLESLYLLDKVLNNLNTNAVLTNVHKYTEINYKQFKYACMSVNIFYVFEYCKYYKTYKLYKCSKGKDCILLHI